MTTTATKKRTARGRPTGADTLDALLLELPTAALECRELRHAWPRGKSARMEMTPIKMRGNRVVTAERRMECTAGCGVVRVERYTFDSSGRIYRDGKPAYKYTQPYLVDKSRLSPQAATEAIDRDHLRLLTFERMFPGIKW